ncbi:hypothetical protein ABZ318_25020 [Streptomyces sp. NPDC006197]|uniref:hypothetical protein n=1 Tax=Streptomyces sp. NPDC006197 TaxID=3156685 RepID=UPI0033BAFED7
MTDLNTDICPIPTLSGDPCESGVVWEVTPERDVAPYLACGQHVTAPIMRAGELVPFTARPI